MFRFLDAERERRATLRRHHPRPADRVGRARVAVGAEARLPRPDRRRLRAVAGGRRPPLDLVEHAPRPERAQARRRRHRPGPAATRRSSSSAACRPTTRRRSTGRRRATWRSARCASAPASRASGNGRDGSYPSEALANCSQLSRERERASLGYSWRAAMRVLLVTPPMTQLNTPYPATAYLMGCLRKHAATGRGRAGGPVDRAVPAAVLARRADGGAGRARRRSARRRGGEKPLRAGSSSRVGDVRRAGRAGRPVSPGPRRQPRHAHRRARVSARGPALRVARRRRGDDGDSLGWAFGELGVTDRARHLASLFIDDLADVIRDGIDPALRAVALRREARRRARPASIRSPTRSTPRRRWSIACSTTLARDCVRAHAPDVVGLTVPFPGNLYGALRIARVAKAERPAAKVVLGGGYVNTELRQLGDAARVRRLRLHHAR